MSHKVIESLTDNVVSDMKNNPSSNVNPAILEKLQRTSRDIA